MNVGLLESLRLFARVVETGSFTRVAEEFGLTQPSVSRRIAALEENYRTRLLERSTRSVRPTEDGMALYDQAHRVFDAVEDAAGALNIRGRTISGRVRVAASVVFGRLELLPRIARFLDLYPEISLDLQLSDRAVDLVEDGIDVAIRIGPVEQAGLILRPLGANRRVLVADKAYWARYGLPQTPEDLSRHACLVFTGLSEQGAWAFCGPEGERLVPITGRLTFSTSDALREAVLLGLGPTITPSWFFRRELANGTVVAALEEYSPRPRAVQAVMPSRRLQAPRVRAFVDWLSSELRGDAYFNT